MELITPFQIYLFTRIEPVYNLFHGGGFVFIVITLGAIAAMLSAMLAEDGNDFLKNIKFNVKWYAPIAIVMFLGNILIPSQKEVAAMYIIPAVVNNTKVQEIAKNVGESSVNVTGVAVKATEKWLQEYTGDNTVKLLVDTATDKVKQQVSK